MIGFGGSNAHAILEEYSPATVEKSAKKALFTPFLFSALTEASLVAQLRAYSDYLKNHTNINATDLAWTLQARRSHLSTKASFSAPSVENLVSKIDTKLATVTQTPGTTVGVRSGSKQATRARILGVFTGQGAQWPAMGAELIRRSEFVRNKVLFLEQALTTLPEADRPPWRLLDEMLAAGDASRIAEAALSQPLCTVVQIILVDLLQIVGITFSSVVGHSSGEIGAAYAAGLLSAQDAVRVAYYRGLHAKLAGNTDNGQKGAMLAVGTSWEDAQDLVGLQAFKGRLAIAAHNSPASVTLSGDADAIIHAKKIFDEEKKFARFLKVDTAYHSHHMLPCGEAYVQSLRDCGVQVRSGKTTCSWFSSVVPSDKGMRPVEELSGVYWRENMTKSVLFADAVRNAVASDEQLTLAIEVGPHPALKGPATQIISDVRSMPLPYCGVLSRGNSDVEAFSEALGFIWAHLDARAEVDFQALEKALASGSYRPQLVTGLPSYQWNHTRSYWSESRKSRRARGRKQVSHEVLGSLSPDSNAYDLRWANVLKPSELSWLDGHQLQSQRVFPAAGYVSMALEASRSLAGEKSVEVFELHNLAIPRAITFEDGDSLGVETLVTLTGVKHHYKDDTITADFSCFSVPVVNTGSAQDMELMSSGTVRVVLGSPDASALACIPPQDYNMAAVDTDHFYSTLGELGYGYNGPFRAMSCMKRRLNQSAAMINSYPYDDDEHSVHMVHPSLLDVAFQASMLAYSAPGDDRLWSLHVPTSIRTIRVNPAVCASLPLSGAQVPACTVLDGETQGFCANVDIYSEDGQYTMVQVEDLVLKPFAPATEADDRPMYTYTKLDLATPDASTVVADVRPSANEVELVSACDRISQYLVRKWKKERTGETLSSVGQAIAAIGRRKPATWKKEWSGDTADDIEALINKYPESSDVKLLTAIAGRLSQDTTPVPLSLVRDHHKNGLGLAVYHRVLGNVINQIAHRYPHARILELGGATKAILASIQTAFSSYTYTNISAETLGEAAKSLRTYSDKMSFKVLDLGKPVTSQGYEPHSYDVVIASSALRATASTQATLENTRKLLKPGGYLIILEPTTQSTLRLSNVLLPGTQGDLRYAPVLTPGEWHSALRKAGFAGVDSITPETHGAVWPYAVMVSQAVDDQVQFLRQPLGLAKKSPAAIRLDSVVILGNKSLESARIAEGVAEYLGRFCGELIVLDSLPTEDEALDLAPMSTFINLVDLDSPIFKDITTDRMDGLKRVFELAKHILWVTHGAMVDEPYHMASIAFSRSVRNEAGHISLNHLDLLDIQDDAPKVVAEHLLRQSALDDWETSATGDKQHQQLLWSKEPETFVQNGRIKVPRLLSNAEQNARINSEKRVITTTVPVSGSQVSISAADNKIAVVQNVFPGNGSLMVESSSLFALQTTPDTYLYAAMGQDSAQKSVLVLTTTNSSQVAPVASVEVPSAPSSLLLAVVVSNLLAQSVVDGLSIGSHVLVHCTRKDRLFASALLFQADAKGLRVTFVCDTDSATQDTAWLILDRRAPQHALRKALHQVKPTHFLDLFPSDGGLGLRIAQVLPAGYRVVDASTFYQQGSWLPIASISKLLQARLQSAVDMATAQTSTTLPDNLVIAFDQIHGTTSPPHPNSIVQWPTEGTMQVQVRTLDARQLFSQNKTYLLAGLSGSIGQSLCEWMVANGAGCVCLTSRRPNVDPRWLDSFQGTNAIVKVVVMDLTDRQSVERVIREIQATCPPIAGVANGAMVLNDALFSNMSTEAMLAGLRPKIDGSNHLDEIFYNDPLDFFIGFSSSSCVVGNPGQCNYAAANGYINGLVRQRRRRGLAASAFDIGRVAGVGVLQTADQAVVEQLTNFGLAAISEPDLRHLFAETIVAGRPDGVKDQEGIPTAVVTTGIRKFRDNEEVKGPWFSNPMFSHCVVDSENAESGGDGQKEKSRLPVSQQLASAASQEEALEILKNSFTAKLQVMLQLPDQELDPEAPLSELGIDSLIAVGVRSWFLKELKVDIPVLKVVGGASIVELAQTAFEKLPENLVASIGQQTKPAPPVAKSTKPQMPAVSQLHQKISQSGVASAFDETPQATPSTMLTPFFDRNRSPVSGTTVSTSPGTTPSEPKVAEKSEMPALALSSATDRPARRYLKSEPISLSQSRFWFLRLLLEDQRTTNVAFYYHIAGNLRIGDLERAIRVVTTRHEALRTCFVEDPTTGAGEALQKVLPSSPVRLDRKKINSEADVATEYQALQEHDFDLASGNLLKLVLLSLSSSSHYLLINYPHILMDGVSFQVFLSDLEKAYNGQSLGAPARQFAEYSVTQRLDFEAGKLNQELEYWREIFPAGEQPPILPLLPMARTSSRVAMKSFDTHQVVCHLEPALAARVRQVSKAQRSTPFHFYLAAFKSLLFSFTNAQDLTIGIADAGRPDQELMSSIGLFLNLLTLRFRRDAKQAFSDAIVETRDMAYSALANSRLPFDILLAELDVTRSSTHSPFFQAFLDYRQGAKEKHPWGNTQFEFQDMHPGRTAYDITLDITDNADDALIMLRAQKSLYDLTGARLLLETFVHFLDILSRDSSMVLEAIPRFGEKQLNRAIQIGRGTFSLRHEHFTANIKTGPQLASTWPATLPHRIDQIAQQVTDKVALRDGTGANLTYSDMTDRIEAIAESLLRAGVSAGSRVLVFQHATADWVCSMLAIMRIGAVYVPLDLRNPMPRLAAVAQDCEPAAALVDTFTVTDVPQLQVAYVQTIDVSVVPRKALIHIANSAQADAPAAILYTSGSTGTPKGIVVTHAGLRNEIEGYTKTWKLGAERVLQQSAFTFNHSSDQIYTGLVNGGMVYIVPTSQRGDPLEITKILREQAITYTKATPSEYSLWIQYGGENLRQASEWRFAFGGGEPLTTTVTSEFADLGLVNLAFYNSYGPTEISISSHKMHIAYREKQVLEDMGRIPCGYSLPNYHTYVVDEQLRPLPCGMPGEICIGGAGVSRGYLHNAELTDKQFVANPLAMPEDLDNGWTRMYRTSDIGHLQEDGAMVFHNRIAGDTQVKIRGLRIELSDIESNIIAASAGSLKEAIVTLREGDPEFLVAHVVFSPQHAVTDKEAFLSQLLSQLPIPQYMIPVVAIPLDKLPLTNHSKVDRKAVKAMSLPERSVQNNDEQELTETMIQLKSVWRDVLGKNSRKLGLDMSPSTSFFSVGGNSLLAIRLQSRIRAVFHVTIRLVDLLGANTLGDMARKIEESASVGAIDWDHETTPPSIPSFLLASAPPSETTGKAGKVVLMTGATGFLAKHLLPQLSSIDEVSEIHCVAVRSSPSGDPRKLHHYSPKIVTHGGDLSLPRLGLSEGEFSKLASQVDVILHLGGVRSFWDNYHVLRTSNVSSTKEVIKLAAPRKIPIHYISTVGVLPRDAELTAAATSAASYVPLTDGTNGYVASRWASERILERSEEALGVPSTIYRFLPAAKEVEKQVPQEVLDEIIRVVDLSGLVPELGGWSGRTDLISAEQVSSWLLSSLLSETSGTQYVHYESTVVIDGARLERYIQQERGDRGLDKIPVLKWFGRIKALGFAYFLSGQDAVVESAGQGTRLESRR